MAKEVTASGNPVQDFQDKLIERVRNDIGELLPDEVLQQVVAKAFEKAFFEERRTTDNYNRTETKEPLLVETVRKAAAEAMKAATHEWLAENPEIMEKMIEQQLKEGLAMAAFQTVRELIDGKIGTLRIEVASELEKAGIGTEMLYSNHYPRTTGY